MNNGWLWGWEMNEVGIWDEVVLVLFTWASFQNQKTQKATSNWLFQNFSLGSLFSLWPQLCSWLHLTSHQTTHTPAWTWESGLAFWLTRQGQEFGWLWESAELVLHILTTPYFFILLIHKEENKQTTTTKKTLPDAAHHSFTSVCARTESETINTQQEDLTEHENSNMEAGMQRKQWVEFGAW